MQIIGLGAGGHAKVVIEILNYIGSYEIIALLDINKALWGTEVVGIPVTGNDELLAELYKQGIRHAFIGLGTTGDTRPREKLYNKARELGFDIISAVHPQSIISKSVRVGCGPTIMSGAIVNACARIGDNVIINTGAIIEHDCIISDHVHIATGASLASSVHVGDGTHIGIGATIRQGIRIGSNAIVGAGAVVVKDVDDYHTVVGNPARPLVRDSYE